VAGYLARKLEHLPVEISLQSIERLPAEEIAGFDILALGFPVYECDSLPFFREYLRRLPRVEDRGLFIFCTKGAFAGNACRRNFERLVSRGYVPLWGRQCGRARRSKLWGKSLRLLESRLQPVFCVGKSA